MWINPSKALFCFCSLRLSWEFPLSPLFIRQNSSERNPQWLLFQFRSICLRFSYGLLFRKWKLFPFQNKMVHPNRYEKRNGLIGCDDKGKCRRIFFRAFDRTLKARCRMDLTPLLCVRRLLNLIFGFRVGLFTLCSHMGGYFVTQWSSEIQHLGTERWGQGQPIH